MADYFSELSALQLIFWVAAVLGSSIFAIMLILSLFGVEAEGDVDADIDGDVGAGVQFFTFKNVMAFFTLFGWTGIVCIDSGYSSGMAVAIATMAGLAMMVLLAFLFFWISKLAESGTLKIKNAVGAVGEVYLTLGAGRSSLGKITVDVQGSKRELSALTDEEEDLKQGTVIKVLDVVSGEILLVEKLTK